jgi:glyoxylase-like metal-dependent hydrolase (beta-lactamase superfamily II)
MEIINIGNMILNTFIVKINGINIQIDTGYPDTFQNYKKKLGKNSISIHSIDYIVLTHAHDDHAGFINEMMKETNATIVLHEKAIERLKIGHNLWIGGCSGMLALFFVKAMSLLGKGKHLYPIVDIKINSIVFNGKKQPLIEKGLPVKILELPGHTEDSIGIVVNNEVLFCGDAAMNGFPSINRNIIWIESLEQYKSSWKTMIQEEVKMIYPGHGNPFPKEDLIRNSKKIDRIKIRPIKEPIFS